MLHTRRLAFALACVSVASACIGGGSLQLGGSPRASGPARSASGPPLPGPDEGPVDEVTGGGGGGGSGGASAPHLDGFAFEVKEYTQEWHRAWVISKLTTIKVGPTCAKNMIEHKDKHALDAAGRYTRDVAKYALEVTGEDWARIESQSGDRLANARLVEPMIDDFKAKFHFTLEIDGDDCEMRTHAFWARYWYYASAALVKYPPRAGKAFITVRVSSKARDISVDIDPSGSKFLITAPKDIEPPPPSWPDRIEKPFRKVSSKG